MTWLEKVKLMHSQVVETLQRPLSDGAREAFDGLRVGLSFAITEFEKDQEPTGDIPIVSVGGGSPRRYGR